MPKTGWPRCLHDGCNHIGDLDPKDAKNDIYCMYGLAYCRCHKPEAYDNGVIPFRCEEMEKENGSRTEES